MAFKAPVQVGGAVSPPYFVGRTKETREIVDGLKTLSQNYVILAPRRVGKTSLMWAVKGKLDREKDLLAVYFNCREITTREGFARKLIEAVLEEYEKKHAAKGYIGNFRRSVKGKILDAMRRIEKIGGSFRNICEIYITFREGEIDEGGLLQNTFRFLGDFSAPVPVQLICVVTERIAGGIKSTVANVIDNLTSIASGLPKNTKVLIVNDIARSGHTLLATREFLKVYFTDENIKVATLFRTEDTEDSEVELDFCVALTNKVINFEWKQRET